MKLINIKYEVSAVIAITITGLFLDYFSKDIVSTIAALILLAYIIGIISISSRSVLIQEKDKSSKAAFNFGIICGLCFGSSLALLTNVAENLGIAMITLGIIIWGIAGGLIAAGIVYIISSFLRGRTSKRVASMSFKKSKTTRIVLLLVGLVGGFIFGTAGLGGLWYVVTGIVMSYGDSGPAWFNTVTHLLGAIGSIAGLVIAHYIYIHYGDEIRDN